MTKQADMDALAAARKEAGRNINPATAEISWNFGAILDPYGDVSDLPEEYRCVGRIYFARSPDSDTWVTFYDLPKATSDALWERMKKPRSPEPEWGSNEDYFFDPRRVSTLMKKHSQ